MYSAVINELFIYFIGNNKDFVRFGKGCNVFHLLLRQNMPRRIAGIADNQHLRAVGSLFFQHLSRKVEAIFDLQRNRDIGGSRHLNNRAVRRISRCGHETLVALFEKGKQGLKKSQLCSRSNNDPVFVGINTVFHPEFPSNGTAERDDSGSTGVMGLIVPDGLYSSLFNAFRGIKIRFPGSERQNINSLFFHFNSLGIERNRWGKTGPFQSICFKIFHNILRMNCCSCIISCRSRSGNP